MKRVAGACLLLLAITACTTKRGYVEKGNRLYELDKYQAAEINYRKAIQKDPKYGEAYYRLGLDEIKEENLPEAYNALYRASQLLPRDLGVQEMFADFCLEQYLKDPTRPQKLYQQIQVSAEQLQALNPNSFDALRLKGYLAYADRKPQEAVAYFQKAVRMHPDSAPVTTALVETLNESGQAQAGETLALNFLARRKDYGPLYDALSRIYLNSNRPADAENILRRKVDNNPRNADYILQLATHYALSGNTAEMNAALGRILNDPADFRSPQFVVGDFFLQQKNYPEALRYYEEGAKAHPNEKAGYKKRAMAALLADKKYDEAGRLVDQLLKDDPHDQVVLRVHADLLLTAGGAANASAALPILLDELENHPGDDGPSLRFQLGRAYELKGDLESARPQFSEAIRMRRDYLPAEYELAEIYLQEQRPSDALTEANTILTIAPKDERARLLRARSLLASLNTEGARQELTQLLKDSPKNVGARLELGFLALQQKKYPEAISILNALKDNGDARAYTGLIDAYARAGQIDKAVQVANEGFKRFPDAALIREQLAISAAMSGKFDLAVVQFQKVIASDPKTVANYVRLGAIFDMKGDAPQAIQMFQQAHDLAPNDLGPALTLAQALAKAGRRADANTVFQNILRVHPNDPTALNNTAYFLCDNGGNLDEALRLAQSAVQKQPDDPAFADTLGYVYLKKGMRNSAIQTFSSLVRKYPTYSTYHYHLGMALYETGDKIRARKELRDALAAHPTRRDAVKISDLLTRVG